jgi:hypothetical protein
VESALAARMFKYRPCSVKTPLILKTNEQCWFQKTAHTKAVSNCCVENHRGNGRAGRCMETCRGGTVAPDCWVSRCGEDERRENSFVKLLRKNEHCSIFKKKKPVHKSDSSSKSDRSPNSITVSKGASPLTESYYNQPFRSR